MPRHVAILGAGIMGAATAIFLARRKVDVTLFEAAATPLAGASRWNEGKIHLGYLYSGDASLETARRILPGGLAFKRLTEELIGCRLDAAVTGHDDTYLIHHSSVTSPARMDGYVAAVTELAAGHPAAGDYLVDLRRHPAQRVPTRVLENDYDLTDIVAGYRVPERSVSTTWLADKLTQAVEAEPRIRRAMSTRVLGVAARDESLDGALRVDTSAGRAGPFDAVVNALWEGRIAIDAGLGLRLAAGWSHRYRLSLFVRSEEALRIPSTVIATGPFGDVKNYNDRDFYLSWYEAGLVAEGRETAPPPVPRLGQAERGVIENEILAQLGRVVPAVNQLAARTTKARLEGGWVYAMGQGSLADPRSTLHRRDRIGIERRGAYVSVDTGKYSIAPWLALEIATSLT